MATHEEPRMGDAIQLEWSQVVDTTHGAASGSVGGKQFPQYIGRVRTQVFHS